MKALKLMMGIALAAAPMALISSAHAGATGAPSVAVAAAAPGTQNAKLERTRKIGKVLDSWLNTKLGCVNQPAPDAPVQALAAQLQAESTPGGVFDDQAGPAAGIDGQIQLVNQYKRAFAPSSFERGIKAYLQEARAALAGLEGRLSGSYADQQTLESSLQKGVSDLGVALGFFNRITAMAAACAKNANEITEDNVRQACQSLRDEFGDGARRVARLYALATRAKSAADCVESEHQLRFWACQARQVNLSLVADAPTSEPAEGARTETEIFDHAACDKVSGISAQITDPMDFTVRALTRSQLWDPAERVALAEIASESAKKKPITRDAERKMDAKLNMMMRIFSETDEAHGCAGVPAESAPASD